jgi:hypothetical protein
MESNGLQNVLLAEETHVSRIWSLVLLPVLVVPVISVFVHPPLLVQVSLVATVLVVLGALALIWSGFQYRFRRHGVEVRTLGFTLRTIPKQQIMGYSIEPWSLLRGYGIRGIGNRRAYVWCNKVVHIKTTDADIFLGHDDPERIVRDLDQMMGFSMSHAQGAGSH